MKQALLISLFVVLVLALIACFPNAMSIEVEAPVHMAIKAALPTGTPEPIRERPNRSYPAPTGYPGFRVYYQKRCYPGCHSYPSATPTSISAIEASQERPYRSYPAPTGYPGFRVYYQKRCYPGCHTYSTPTSENGLAIELTQKRPYRSYPAPTGYPGFRVYYQKRCYPGCHSYGTPVPTRVHP
jgi:hypothetical protein